MHIFRIVRKCFFCHNIHEMYASISDKIEQECILKVYHVSILYHVVVINMLDFMNLTWRLIHTRILNYNMFVDLTAHISQWKNVLYSIWFFF